MIKEILSAIIIISIILLFIIGGSADANKRYCQNYLHASTEDLKRLNKQFYITVAILSTLILLSMFLIKICF
jgi:hypothetical protein